MKIRVGDRIEYWAGLGGSRLKEGRIKRIEIQVGISDGEPTTPALVNSWEASDPDRGAFVDLEDGTWTYAHRIRSVVTNPRSDIDGDVASK